ncbi:hypothetical protein Zmor_000318 [Zophobas morio]|uniref:Uncharacterized protein n=1 Tax=Zophobas morio TaxID=2755281 RepID=A0AA38MNG4_9CUCU|nr:hypothetical protein Zmor_000318 [Zophobas morio]
MVTSRPRAARLLHVHGPTILKIGIDIKLEFHQHRHKDKQLENRKSLVFPTLHLSTWSAQLLQNQHKPPDRTFASSKPVGTRKARSHRRKHGQRPRPNKKPNKT